MADEAVNMVRVMSKYLPLDRLADLVVDLDKEIAERTENAGLRQFIHDMRDEVEDNSEQYGGRQSVHSIKGNVGLRTYADKK